MTNVGNMGVTFRKKINEDTLYAIWQITESVEELQDAISLREDEKVLYETFVAENRKKQWLAYRLLIRTLLKPEDYPVEYDQSGKPFLAGSDIHISVTHTDDLAAVIMSRSARVGIDMERVRPRVAKVKERFLNPQELDSIGKKDELEQLTLAWCAKEALYKLYGARDLDFRDQIRLALPVPPGSRFNAEINYAGKTDRFTLFSDATGGYMLVYLCESMI